ncbi:hypothetical protein MRX96_030403 [Rhipicephalus microplus]
MSLGAPFISLIETPRESTFSVPVHVDHLDRLLHANDELNRKVYQLATQLSALNVEHHRNALRQRHQRQRHNLVADVLFRTEINAIIDERPPVDFAIMATVQQDDSELQVLRLQQNFLKLEDVQLPGCAIPIISDISTGCPRPEISAPFRRKVFDALQSLSQPGIRVTQGLITGRYLWLLNIGVSC